MKKIRADQLLVDRGLAETRSKARARILAGEIFADGARVDKAGQMLRAEAALEERGRSGRYVSRGGLKLEGALEDFNLNVEGVRALDIGASTGGFTDCLLQSGARHVFAVDVGYGQLDARLRADPRVTAMERSNARHLEAAALAPTPDLVAIDVSFISVRLLLPVLARQLPRAELLVLVKPQFEVGRGQVGKGGVVRDAQLRAAAVAEVVQCATQLGWRAIGQAESRLAGPKGNREIFVRFAPRSVDP